MSGAGTKRGGNFFSNVGDTFSKPFTKKSGNTLENIFTGVVNAYTQVVSGGTVGYDGSFSVDSGYSGGGVKNSLKDVTGATAAEKANQQARENFEKTAADAEAARVEEINQVGRDEIRKSTDAQTARASAVARSNAAKAASVGATAGNAVSTNLGDEKDFLGL